MYNVVQDEQAQEAKQETEQTNGEQFSTFIAGSFDGDMNQVEASNV